MAAEIISTVERRRRWPAEEKLRIMSEALEPGAMVAAVADRNGVCRSQLYTWLRLARDDRLPGISITPQPRKSFVPVRIEPPARPTPADCQPLSPPIVPDPRRESPRAAARAWSRSCSATAASLKVDESIDPIGARPARCRARRRPRGDHDPGRACASIWRAALPTCGAASTGSA